MDGNNCSIRQPGADRTIRGVIDDRYRVLLLQALARRDPRMQPAVLADEESPGPGLDETYLQRMHAGKRDTSSSSLLEAIRVSPFLSPRQSGHKPAKVTAELDKHIR